MAEDTATEATETSPEADTRREEVVAAFADRLGDGVVEHHVAPGRGIWLRIATETWAEAAQVARDHTGFRFFDFLSAIDWLPSPYGRYEDAAADVPFPPPPPDPASIERGLAGGESRMQVLASVATPGTDLRVILKADVADDDPRIATWTRTYAGAAWHERETHEMFGITFEGNADLRHIYLPSGFEGHPLRKEFPLLARVVKPWPGIVDVEPMPGEDDSASDADAAGDAPGGDS